ncbi:hypothetical protein T03_5760 [Trichinella britovi]|uniref:Uncharacterized protein n=1 Tax=Trichinella britovi TaxID=45882 RepID=A0A0V1CAA1_TRIBR|nr:hypothetical protein T03_5760 [Trichinella britovi]
MDRPPYVSFHPEISTAEDWLQSWLGAFADMEGLVAPSTQLSPVRVSGQFLHSWYRELLSPRLGRRSSSQEMSHYMAAESSSMRRS